jgi:hypothetical protein
MSDERRSLNKPTFGSLVVIHRLPVTAVTSMRDRRHRFWVV